MRSGVDTGIHAKGWSRDQAIDYMLANSPMRAPARPPSVERYIAIAGQALAYKIGQLTIAARTKAKAPTPRSAPAFDPRAFNAAVLDPARCRCPLLERRSTRLQPRK